MKNIRDTFKQIYFSEQFHPKFLGIFINPFYFSRKELYTNIKLFGNQITGKILDVGCGSKPYKELFLNAEEYIGLDIEVSGHDHTNENIDVYYDGKTIPFEDNSFDGLICFQVFEHVFNPQEFLNEILRVLKPGGKLLLTVPFIWDEHEQPYDYARYSSFGLKHVLELNGLLILDSIKTAPDFRVIYQLVISFFFKKIIKLPLPTKLNLVLIFFITSIFNVIGLFTYWLFGKNNDLYLDNVILAFKK